MSANEHSSATANAWTRSITVAGIQARWLYVGSCDRCRLRGRLLGLHRWHLETPTRLVDVMAHKRDRSVWLSSRTAAAALGRPPKIRSGWAPTTCSRPRLERRHLGVSPEDVNGGRRTDIIAHLLWAVVPLPRQRIRWLVVTLDLSLEDGTCSPPSSALGTSMMSARPTCSLVARMAPCGCIPVTAPVASWRARAVGAGWTHPPPSWAGAR
jgi:hypothetical protein